MNSSTVANVIHHHRRPMMLRSLNTGKIRAIFVLPNMRDKGNYRTHWPGPFIALQHPPAPVSQTSVHGLLPNVPTGLTDQDRRRIEDALDHCASANTRVMYASA